MISNSQAKLAQIQSKTNKTPTGKPKLLQLHKNKCWENSEGIIEEENEFAIEEEIPVMDGRSQQNTGESTAPSTSSLFSFSALSVRMHAGRSSRPSLPTNNLLQRASNILEMKWHKRKKIDIDFLQSKLGGKAMFSKLANDPDNPVVITDQLVHKCLELFKYRMYPIGENIIKYGEFGKEYFVLIQGIADVKVLVEELIEFSDREAIQFMKNPYKQVISMKEASINSEEDPETDDYPITGKRKYIVKHIKKVAQLIDGTGFGERVLMNKNKRRSATVTAVTECHVAYLSRKDFQGILGEILRKEALDRMKFIVKFPLMNTLDTSVILKVLFYIQTKKLKKGDVLYEEGDPTDKIYFIHEGQFQKHKNERTEIYGIMNPDENEKYKIEFSGMPINFELKKNNYFNALAKTKPMKMGYSKIAILTEGSIFGVIEILMGISNRILSAKCCSQSALVYYITKDNFANYIEKYLGEKCIHQSIIERLGLIENSLDNIMQTKKNIIQMREDLKIKEKTSRTNQYQINSNNGSPKLIKEESSKLNHSSTKNLKLTLSPQAGKSAQKIQQANYASLTPSLSSRTLHTEQTTKVNFMNKKAKMNNNISSWDHLQFRSDNQKPKPEITLPSPQTRIEKNVSARPFTAMALSSTPTSSSKSQTGISRKYIQIYKLLKHDDTVYLSTMEDMNANEAANYEKYNRVKRVESCKQLRYKEFGNINERKISRKTSRKDYLNGLPPRPSMEEGKYKRKIKLLPRQSRLVATKHNLFRLVNTTN